MSLTRRGRMGFDGVWHATPSALLPLSPAGRHLEAIIADFFESVAPYAALPLPQSLFRACRHDALCSIAICHFAHDIYSLVFWLF